MKPGIVVTLDKTKNILDGMRKLADNRVLVGVPLNKAERNDDEPITNAVIGYVQEYGSPEMNIPARPHLVPGVKGSKGDWTPRLSDAAIAALEGKPDGVERNLNAAGLIGQNAVRAVITAGEFVPLATATLKARQRDAAKKAGGLSKLKAVSIAPLIVTGQYLKSITYVLRKGK